MNAMDLSTVRFGTRGQQHPVTSSYARAIAHRLACSYARHVKNKKKPITKRALIQRISRELAKQGEWLRYSQRQKSHLVIDRGLSDLRNEPGVKTFRRKARTGFAIAPH
jgi:hypothetical protein